VSLEQSIVAVTGSGGFIGRNLSRALARRGALVRSLVRYRSDLPGDYQFDLSQNSIDPEALKPPVRAVVHCAWDLKPQEYSESKSTNVEGTQWLIDCCLKAGVEQFVFVSSMAAHAEAQSAYGLTKWDIEKRLLALPNASTFSTVIAPGTVIGNGGVFLKARAMVKKLPVIPVFYASGGRRLQTVFIDDLCDAIVTSISNRVTGKLYIAETEGVAPKEFYRGLALLEGKRPLLCPLPGDVALLGVRALEAIGMKPSVSSNNLLGLKQLRHFDVTKTVAALGCQPMLNFWQSLERLAVAEGRTDLAKEIADVGAMLRSS
jgi:nucleoside-diphosphate-sugar epimerase